MFSTLVIALFLGSIVQTIGKAINVDVHYPERQFPDNCWYMLVTYGLMDGTGSFYDENDNFKPEIIAQKYSNPIHNKWWNTFTNVDLPTESVVGFNIHAVNYCAWFSDQTVPGYISSYVSQNGRCLIDPDQALMLTGGLVMQNLTIKFVDDVVHVDLYPSFCFGENKLVEVGELGDEHFMPRQISMVIPSSMIENPIKRNYSIFYVLDGSPNLLEMMKGSFSSVINTAQARDIIVVGVPAILRSDEFIPFEGILDNEMIRARVCLGVCYNNHTGTGAFLHEYILNTIEPAVLSRLQSRVSGINRRGIFGYSLGGLMVLYETMFHPDKFDLYGAGSPAVWTGLDETMSRWTFPQLPQDVRVFVGTSRPGDTMIDTTTNIFTSVAIAYGTLIPGVNYIRSDLWPAQHAISSAIALTSDMMGELLKVVNYL